MGLFDTKKGFFGQLSKRIGDAIMARPTIDEELFEELEEILITSDVGMDTTMAIMDGLKKEIDEKKIYNPQYVKPLLVNVIKKLIDKGDRSKMSENFPLVILVVGINGGGKTTSIAKLAAYYNNQGRTVLLAAADTFRAAAADQLKIWADRIGVSTVSHDEGADPSAVIYDAITAAKARNIDVLICDTAGRLQTKKNLMSELEKMKRIVDNRYPEASKETLLVLDATTGKNAISQAEEFNAATDLSGIILTKLDGTAKGGIAITIMDEYDIPIKFIGVGEKLEDLKVFDNKKFAEGVVDE